MERNQSEEEEEEEEEEEHAGANIERESKYTRKFVVCLCM
jgi:hypothetical protein